MTDTVRRYRPTGTGRLDGLALLAGLGMLVAGWRVVLPALFGLRGGVGALHPAALYNRTVISTSYFDDGFVRRGLAGTIIHLWPVDWTTGAVLFTLASVVWLAVPLTVMLHRIGRHPYPARTILLAVVIVASPQTFAGWASDIARTDMFAAGFVAWAAVAMIGLRFRLAIIAILAGTLVHEVALVFGGALLTALFGTLAGSGRITRRSAIAHLCALVVSALAIAVLQSWFTASPMVIARHMMASGLAVSDPGQLQTKAIATYMQVAGSRGLRTAMCFNARGGASYALWALANLIVLAVYVPILGLRRHLLAFSVACILPAALLLFVANDAGRWIQLGVLNGWLLAAVLYHWHPAGRPSRKAVAMAILSFLALLPFGIAKLDRANALPPYVVQAVLTGKGESFEEMVGHCDPRWTDLLPKGAIGMGHDGLIVRMR